MILKEDKNQLKIQKTSKFFDYNLGQAVHVAVLDKSFLIISERVN